MLMVLFIGTSIAYSYESSDSSNEDSDYMYRYKYTAIMLCLKITCEIALFMVRLCDPGVRKFLKDAARASKRRITTYARKLSQVARSVSPNSFLNYTELIDELKQEVIHTQTIEYQLIAISIILLDNYFKIPNIADLTQ